MPTVIGVLGGIASGKSLVARLLAGVDGVVIDADRLAREELDSPAGRAWLRERFGPRALDAAGAPDRAALAEMVFGDPRARADLEGWTHPRVRARIEALLDEALRGRARLVVLDVPLLLENDAQHDLVRRCDVLVFVDVGDEERDRRAAVGRHWKPGEVARREAAQLPLAEKRARADFTIPNSGSREELEAAVAEVRRRLVPA